MCKGVTTGQGRRGTEGRVEGRCAYLFALTADPVRFPNLAGPYEVPGTRATAVFHVRQEMGAENPEAGGLWPG